MLTFFGILFNTLDYILTVFALKRGAKEANPIARFLFKHEPACFIVKLGIANIWIFMIDNVISLMIINVLFGLVCINNSDKHIDIHTLFMNLCLCLNSFTRTWIVISPKSFLFSSTTANLRILKEENFFKT